MKRVKYSVILFSMVFLCVESVFAEIVKATDESKVFHITVGEKNASHPFFGRGSKMGFILDGEQGKPIVLTRGVKYLFDVSTNVKHDFYFSTAKAGWGTGTVTQGIKGQFTYRGTVTFKPSQATPNVMYYACRNHKFMGGKIYIADLGQSVEVIKDKPKVTSLSEEIPARKVKNRLMLAGMIMKSSKSSPAMISRAKELIQLANKALDEGRNAEAMTSAKVAIALLKGIKEPKKIDKGALKKEYQKALENIKGFETSYHKQSKEFKEDGDLDKENYDSLLAEAKALAGKEEYQKASQVLEKAQGLLSMALSKILKNNQIVDKRDLSDPKEKFKYELDRYKGYEDLIPVGIEMKKPSEMMKKMMMTQVDKSKETVKEAKRRAKKGNYHDANILVGQAIGEIRRALRLIGVR